MNANEILKNAELAGEFLKKVMMITGNDIQLLDATDKEIIHRMTVAQYAHDILLNEAEQRGLLIDDDGVPGIPYDLPEDVDVIETILTR